MLRPCQRASHTTISSRRPRLPGGFVSWLCRSAARAAASPSGGGRSRHAARSSSSDENRNSDSWVARARGLPQFPAAGFTIAASLAATGCLHEDGLADVADSFGGRTRERKLEIMRDSRIGTYGACALLLSLLLRSAALSSIADPALAAPVLVAAHMGARSNMALFMRLVAPAREDGLSGGVGTAPGGSATAAGIIRIAALRIRPVSAAC